LKLRSALTDKVKNNKIINKPALLKYDELKGLVLEGLKSLKKEELINKIKENIDETFYTDFTEIMELVQQIRPSVVQKFFKIKRSEVGSKIIELYLEKDNKTIELLRIISEKTYSSIKTEEIELGRELTSDEVDKIIDDVVEEVKTKIRFNKSDIEPIVKKRVFPIEEEGMIYATIEYERGLRYISEFRGPPPRKGPHQDIPKSSVHMEAYLKEGKLRIRGAMNDKASRIVINTIRKKTLESVEGSKFYVINKEKLAEFLINPPENVIVKYVEIRAPKGELIQGVFSIRIYGSNVSEGLKILRDELRSYTPNGDFISQHTLGKEFRFEVITFDEERNRDVEMAASIHILENNIVRFGNEAGASALKEILIKNEIIVESGENVLNREEE